MADVTISQLPLKASVSSTDVLPITNGTTTSKVTVSSLLNSAVPIGTIVMWSNRGGVGIPSGWQICDGSNGTPDLRDRFIVGSGNSYAIGNTGGSNSVTLTVAQMPSHNHQDNSWFDKVEYDRTTQLNINTSRNGIAATRTASGTYTNIGGNGNNSPGVQTYSFSTGGGQSHENRPPYYALAYIQKVS